MQSTCCALLQDTELMPQNQSFGFQPPSRLETVVQQADEKEGNCEHPTICSDSLAIANPMDGVFGTDTRASIGRYPTFYNGRRPHSSLDGSTPDKAYFNPLPIRMAA